MTSAKCRDAALAQEIKTNATLKIVRTLEVSRPGGLPVALVAHTTTNRDGSTTYRVRGFVASDDVCGDLEFYSDKAISDEDADLKKVFLSYRLDPNYAPQFSDVALYAQVLFLHHDYGAAGCTPSNARSSWNVVRDLGRSGEVPEPLRKGNRG